MSTQIFYKKVVVSQHWKETKKETIVVQTHLA